MNAAPTTGPPPPRANPDLVGHHRAEAVLAEAVAAGRLAHAWLVTGPPGVGKATLAYRLARFVLVGGGGDLFGKAQSLAVDPVDPVARRVAVGSHADLMTVEPTYDEKRNRQREEIVVEDVRAVGSFLRLTPAESTWRVVVVDSADKLNVNAANALLKVLEEPPDNALLLLIRHAPAGLLPTIRSRCRQLAVRPLAEGTVRDFLGRYRPSLDEEEAAALARLAEGSPGRAVALADRGGLEIYRQMLDLVGQAPHLDVVAVYELAERVSRSEAGPAYRTLMELLTQWLARLVRNGASTVEPAEVIAGEDAAARRLLDAGGLERWVEVWEKIGHLAALADRVNLDRKQVVVAAFSMLKAAARP